MTSWKDFFVHLSVGAEAQFDQLKNRLLNGLTPRSPIELFITEALVALRLFG